VTQKVGPRGGQITDAVLKKRAKDTRRNHRKKDNEPRVPKKRGRVRVPYLFV
jgi:hypothetical protein